MAMTYLPLGLSAPLLSTWGWKSRFSSQKLYQADSTTFGMYALWKSSSKGFKTFLSPAGVSSVQSANVAAAAAGSLGFFPLGRPAACCCCACFSFLLANFSSFNRCFSLMRFPGWSSEDIFSCGAQCVVPGRQQKRLKQVSGRCSKLTHAAKSRLALNSHMLHK